MHVIYHDDYGGDDDDDDDDNDGDDADTAGYTFDISGGEGRAHLRSHLEAHKGYQLSILTIRSWPQPPFPLSTSLLYFLLLSSLFLFFEVSLTCGLLPCWNSLLSGCH
tara:strand:- start:332 stop:655 length:324 start_codon:yes stop_codon:yes gene_type:complete